MLQTAFDAYASTLESGLRRDHWQQPVPQELRLSPGSHLPHAGLSHGCLLCRNKTSLTCSTCGAALCVVVKDSETFGATTCFTLFHTVANLESCTPVKKKTQAVRELNKRYRARRSLEYSSTASASEDVAMEQGGSDEDDEDRGEEGKEDTAAAQPLNATPAALQNRKRKAATQRLTHQKPRQ